MALAKLELCVTYVTINGFRTDRFSKDYRLTVFAGFFTCTNYSSILPNKAT